MTNFAFSPTFVRSLKNALQDRFPFVKSAHLSEAIAATAGFRTNAALLAYLKGASAIPHVQLHDLSFVRRLHELGYLDVEPFSFSAIGLSGHSVPQEIQELITRLSALEDNPLKRHAEINALRSECAGLFAARLGIGYVETKEDNELRVKRFYPGIDYKACLTGWGRFVNANHAGLNFPGIDHTVRFFERLPLSMDNGLAKGSSIRYILVRPDTIQAMGMTYQKIRK